MSKDIFKGVVPEGVTLDNDNVPYIKGADFDGEGLTLKVVGTEVITPEKGENGEDYGVKNIYGSGGVLEKENFLISKGILKEGQSLRYNFLKDEEEKHFDNYSVTFFFAMKNAEVEEGDIVKIKREKITNFKVEWEITKVKK